MNQKFALFPTQKVNEAKQLIPLSNYGIKCMSMGFLAEKVGSVSGLAGQLTMCLRWCRILP